MKSQSPRPWTWILAFGAVLGLAGCEGDELSQTALSGISAAGATVMLATVADGDLTTGPAPTAREDTPLPADLAPAAAHTSPHPALPPGVDEVVQLAQTQIGDEVLLAYIDQSPARFELDLQEILYLHDLGLSAQVIAAMIRHNQDLDPSDVPDPVELQQALASAPEPGPQPTDAEAPPAPTAAAVSTAPVTQEVTHNHFYTALSPYGRWVEVPEHGWTWRPTVAVVDPNWRPYVHGGRWIFTDHGWYWHSYYSWGWAPFHYGRWHLSGVHGWVWVPDTRWGPAWVTWRYYDGYYGWAPLPPAAIYTSGIGLTYHGRHVGSGFSFGLGVGWYSFVPVRHFYSPRPWHFCAPHGRVTHIYNNSTVINNYIVGDNNTTIINVGPNRGTIASASRTEIQKVQIRDAQPGERNVIRAESLSRDGTTLTAYRPQLPQQAAAPPPEITRRQAEVQRRAETIANSNAAQVATIRARQDAPAAGRQLSDSPPDRARPTTAPRVVRADPSTPISRPESNLTSPGSRNPTPSRGEPQARSANPAVAADSGAAQVTETPRARANAPVARPTTPVRPETATVPAAPRAPEPRRTITPQVPQAPATPRPEPPARLQPAQRIPSAPAIPSPSPRVEPVRPGNPSYSVTPQAPPTRSVQPFQVPRPVNPPVANPAPQVAPRFEPPARPSFVPSAPAPVPPQSVVPSRPSPIPAPAPSQAPSIPSRSIGPTAAPRPVPAPAPARPAAPAQPPRGATPR
jgi:hypothetical protein